MGCVPIDLNGMTFGRLKVLYASDIRINEQIAWVCECSCENHTIVTIRGYQLRKGLCQSCGCYAREQVSKAKKMYNEYDLSGEYGIGYNHDGREFYFTLSDHEKIKDFRWGISSTDGYLYARNQYTRQHMVLHRFLLDFPEFFIDHKNRNKLDNRRENLREATQAQNTRNISLKSNSTTGVVGVTTRKYNEKRTVYVGTINIDGVSRHLGESKDFDKIVKLRLWAEREYFKEFSPNIHLWEQYGVPPLDEE